MEVSVTDVQLESQEVWVPRQGEATQAATPEAGDDTASFLAPGKLARPQSESRLQTRLPPRNTFPTSAILCVSERRICLLEAEQVKGFQEARWYGLTVPKLGAPGT